jgi:hypothetical protein
MDDDGLWDSYALYHLIEAMTPTDLVYLMWDGKVVGRIIVGP